MNFILITAANLLSASASYLDDCEVVMIRKGMHAPTLSC